MEKVLKLVQLLQQSEKERADQDVQFEVKQAELRLQSDILATEKSLADAKMAKSRTLVSRPFNSQAVINADTQIEGLEDGLKRLKALQTELF